jgi:PAS domain S-box-containing protein
MSESSGDGSERPATPLSSAVEPAELYRAADDLAAQLRSPHDPEELVHLAGQAATLLERGARLSQAGLAFSTATRFEEVIRVALRHALSAFPAVTSHLAVLSEEDKRLRSRMQRKRAARPHRWVERSFAEASPLADAIRTGRLLFFPNRELLHTYPTLLKKLPAPVQAFTVLPLQVGARRFGALGFGWRRAEDFGDDEREFLGVFAMQCAVALDRARLSEAQRELRASAVLVARKHAALLESMSDGFVAFDRELRFLYVNRRAVELTGRSAQEVLGRKFDEVFPLARERPFWQAAWRALETGEPFTMELEAGLQARWIEARGYPTPEGISIVFRDVTERKLSEQLQHVLAEMSRIFDAGLNRELMLQRVAELIVPAIADSCTIEVRIGTELKTVAAAPLEPPPVLEAERDVPLRSRAEQIGVMRIGFRAGRRRPENASFFSEIAQRVAIAIDLARMYQGEMLARREAEEANRAKADFLAVMSHELRTPLNAIGGYAELMELGVYGPLEPEYRDFVTRIRASEEHLLSLINSVLSFAKLEAGAIDFEMGDISVQSLMGAIEPFIRQPLNTKGLQYHVNVESGLTMHADADRVRQIILNLLGNAIKFTRKGGTITVVARALDGTCRIEVRDTGIGIPADKLNAIFDPFVQADRSLTRNSGGVGLGLAISRDLARAMSGDLTARSQPGIGSTFMLELPRGANAGRHAA